MRLLHFNDRNEITLTRHLGDHERRRHPYAILSHCWAEDNTEEVTFTEIETELGRQKPGYKKIHFCAEQAKKDGIEYFWIDTCCIDKSSSAELSEAITSMFRWYNEATKCYVYLPEVTTQASNDQQGLEYDWKLSFRKSRWFKRGWTLQELLAPKVVEFFSLQGALLGSKEDLIELIHEITSIPVPALRGAPLSQYSLEERIRWRENRKTTEKEDQAYCLLGIFEVFMPLMYGEGDNALRRLAEEVHKRYNQDVAGSLLGHSQVPSLGLCFNSAPAIEPTHFVGRVDELDQIHTVLRPKEATKEQQRVVLGGVGGIGKTQLAIAYARRFQLSYTSIFWLNAASESTLSASFSSVALAIGAEDFDASDREQTRTTVLRWLARPGNPQWLLIFDNYDDPDLFDINRFCPNNGHGSVIITTRLPDSVTGSALRLEPLQDLADGLRVLQVRSGRAGVFEGEQDPMAGAELISWQTMVQTD
jgi:hypothetical protein